MPEPILLAPLDGWAAPLREVPDSTFADRLVGTGLAIDPTSSTLLAPCDGEILSVAKTGHAITLRTVSGAEILMHVGIDTMALNGEGFTALVTANQAVRQGDPLLSFDIDALAYRAPSLITPIILLNGDQFEIREYQVNRRILAGEPLLRIASKAAAAPLTPFDPDLQVETELGVGLPHGIHARPAARIVNELRAFAATVTLSTSTASAVPASSMSRLMGLGIEHGDRVRIRATGKDAHAALSALIDILSSQVVEAEIAPAVIRVRPEASATLPANCFAGVTAAPGIALGPAFVLRNRTISVPRHVESAELEILRLDQALRATRKQLAGDVDAAAHAQREIYAAHQTLLDDQDLVEAAIAFISGGGNAGQAWRHVIENQVAVIAALDNRRLQERVNDLKDIEMRVLAAMYPGTGTEACRQVPRGCILIAEDLLPSQFATLDLDGIAGICTTGGGTTSHAAIIAATKSIPYLVGLPESVLAIAEQTPLLLNGDMATLTIDPDPEAVQRHRELLAARLVQQAGYLQAAERACRTGDGTELQILANINSLDDARLAARNGADGCGLLRTEFLFLERAAPPPMQEQQAIYQAIADLLPGKPLTIRTLDIGGDKPIAYLPLPREENPALGLRGIRASLWQPEIFLAQLRALLALRHSGTLKIMLPMVASAGEIEAARTLVRQILDSLDQPGAVEIGVMVETPAAALTVDLLAAQADFFSIGTNDLSQYTLAMDRQNAQLGAQNDALHPATLRLIRLVMNNADRCGRPVGICGGLASDPLAAPLLIGLGARSLSVVPALIPQLKGLCRQLLLRDCERLADRAQTLNCAQAVRQLLREFHAAHTDHLLAD